jgi:AcrR family transcriptional regulator
VRKSTNPSKSDPESSGESADVPADLPIRLRRPRRAEVRERLLAAAMTVFTQQGYDHSSLEQVAAAAGFSKGAVYSNFASKDELFLALMDRQVQDFVMRVRTELSAANEGESRGSLAGNTLTALLTRDRDWQLLFLDYVQRAARDPGIREQLAMHRQHLRELIAETVRAVDTAKGNHQLDPESTAVTILALSNGLAIERLIDPGAVPTTLFGTILGMLEVRSAHEPTDRTETASGTE